jgi:hypothetical protein
MSTQRGEVPGIRGEGSSVLGPSIEARMSQGKALRERVSGTSHAGWAAPTPRPGLINVLRHSDCGRLPELLPIRYGRMRRSSHVAKGQRRAPAEQLDRQHDLRRRDTGFTRQRVHTLVPGDVISARTPAGVGLE